MENAEKVTITKAEYKHLLGLKSQGDYLQHQLTEFKRLIFGVKSERFAVQNTDQASLFDLPAEQPQDKAT